MKTLLITLMILTAIPTGAGTITAQPEPAAAVERVRTDDLNTISDITPEQLAARLPADLQHMAADIVRICKREEIKAEFVAALMIWEKRPDLHNYFGWLTTAGKLKKFESDLDCLEWTIPKIKRLYLDPEGRYYNGATVAGVSIYYNDSDFWRESITATMRGLKD